MTHEEIVIHLSSVIADEFEVDKSSITPDTPIRYNVAIDSLALIDLVALVQYEYKVKIPDEEIKKIVTFSDLYDYIEAHA